MIKKHILYIILLCSCASIQSLEGGLSDTTPPKILSQTPDSAQLKVTNPEITLSFDEYIKTKDVNNLLLISPSQATQPIVQIKGKTAKIILKDSLKENTTYTIQINGSIVDNNEGNPYEDKILFSTGNYIDSLTHTGYVINMTNNSTCEDCNVYLYEQTTDSSILKTKPDYIAKTNKAGRYQFNNLPKKQFRIIAIQDLNKNLLLDKSENVSQYKLVQIDTTSQMDSLNIFPYSPKEQTKFTIQKESKSGFLKIASSLPITNTQTVFINGNKENIKLNTTRDTLTITYIPSTDTTLINFVSEFDTIQLQYAENNLKLISKIQLVKLTSKTIQLETNQNILNLDTSLIKITNDSIQIKPDSFTIDKNDITIHIPLNISLSTTLYISSNFISFNNITNRSDTIYVYPRKESDPQLSLNIQHKLESPSILQILQKDRIMYSEVISTDTIISITNLQSGTYSIRIIKDTNKNGIWDTGNPITGKEPEIIQYLAPVELRNNWDKELIINDI